MRTLSPYLTIFLCMLTFYSCKPLYIPNVINTPLFSNKNEIQASVHFGTAGIDPQLAYAITDHIGIMMNGSFSSAGSTDSTNIFPHKHTFGELGVGYYNKLSEKQRFEIYGGYGIGTIKYDITDTNGLIQAKINTTRFFIQPAYGITSKYVDFSVASRFIWINGRELNQQYTRSFWEPAVTTRVGGPNVKGVFQIGLAIPFQDNYSFEYEPLLFSIGIQGSLNKIFD